MRRYLLLSTVIVVVGCGKPPPLNLENQLNPDDFVPVCVAFVNGWEVKVLTAGASDGKSYVALSFTNTEKRVMDYVSLSSQPITAKDANGSNFRVESGVISFPKTTRVEPGASHLDIVMLDAIARDWAILNIPDRVIGTAFQIKTPMPYEDPRITEEKKRQQEKALEESEARKKKEEGRSKKKQKVNPQVNPPRP